MPPVSEIPDVRGSPDFKVLDFGFWFRGVFSAGPRIEIREWA